MVPVTVQLRESGLGLYSLVHMMSDFVLGDWVGRRLRRQDILIIIGYNRGRACSACVNRFVTGSFDAYVVVQ